MNPCEIQQTLDFYAGNEMSNLKKLCYPLITKIGGISNKDYNDFYSIALEVLSDSVFRFDETAKCTFKTFLVGNIRRKFNTEIRDRNREKRIPAKEIRSMDELFDEDGLPISETIPSKFNTFNEVFDQDISETKIETYLKRLTSLQRKIVSLLSDGYKSKEIQEILHITRKCYSNNIDSIQSYENVKILL